MPADQRQAQAIARPSRPHQHAAFDIVALTLAVVAINGWNRIAVGMRSPVGAVDLQAGLDVSHASMADYAARLVAATAVLPAPAALCGWSMGVLVALMAAGRARPHSVILLEVSAPPELQGFHRLPDGSDQENFLTLAGECLLLVEGEERGLGAWDFVHCPPGSVHVFVGVGDGPCVIFMTGSRTRPKRCHYLRSAACPTPQGGVETPASTTGSPPDQEIWDRLPWA